MRVVHVVRQFWPSVGGLEEAVLKLSQALQRRDVDVSVVTLDRVKRGAAGVLPAQDRVGDVPVIRIPFHGSWRYPLAPSVFSHLHDADIVHVHGIDFFFDALAAGRMVHRKPLVASTHGGFFHTSFARSAKRLYFNSVTRLSSRAYRTICASSESDFDTFRAITPRNLALVENGVDIAKWHDRASPVPVRTLIAIGRFATNKNIPALLPILARLRSIDPSWTLCIAGQPWDVSVADIEAAARACGVDAGVTILASPGDADIAAAIGRASYIVSASSYEGFGIGAVEGLSAGLMPILNAIPPFAKLVNKAGCGVLLNMADATASADAIEALHRAVLTNHAGLRKTALSVAAGYGWDAAADLFHRHYLAARGTRQPTDGLLTLPHSSTGARP